MPVTIDEVHAEVEAPPAEPAARPPEPALASSELILPRKLREALFTLEVREQRLIAN